VLETKNAHSYCFSANELQNIKPHRTSKSGKKKLREKKAFAKDREAHNHDNSKMILVAFESLSKNDQKKNCPNFHHFNT